MRRVSFSVVGEPAPQGSKRHVGNGRLIESSRKLKPWRQAVVAAAKEALAEESGWAPWVVMDGPLCVHMSFRVPRGRTVTRRYPTVKPDLDKLERGVLDALTIAGVIADDARVVETRARKKYADERSPQGVRVLVYELEDE